MDKTIELDCAPGGPRPGDLIEKVVEGTILENDPKAHPEATVGRFFGNWTWEFSHISDEEWLKIREVVKLRVKALYDRGTIRYGSW
jgi:hypothetical protein